MTHLTIKVSAVDDKEAIRILKRLLFYMKYDKELNESGYTVGHMFGSGEVEVKHE